MGINCVCVYHRFNNGGLTFSTLFLAFVAAVSLYSFLLLIETRNKVPASFGDIGGVLFGRSMRMLVLVSITTSQVREKKFSFFLLRKKGRMISLCRQRITKYRYFNRSVSFALTWYLLHKVYKLW